MKNFTRTQSGYYLITVVIALVVMLITTLAVIRSARTENVVTGGIAFKQSSVQYGDIGLSSAVTSLSGILNFEANSAGYFATEQALDADGIPTTANWAGQVAVVRDGYSIKTVIERLCTGALPIVTTATQCMNSPPTVVGNPVILYYRVTMQITGPNNTTTYIQGMLAR